jgi:hypothetical protein
LSTNSRIFNAVDVSTDTGEINISGLSFPVGENPAQDTSEQLVNMRMRIKTNVASLTGQFLVSVRWNDGVNDQSWDVALSNTAGAYAEVGTQMWVDASRNVTVQIRPNPFDPMYADGSVDVRLVGTFG